jgi:hypothetical protein
VNTVPSNLPLRIPYSPALRAPVSRTTWGMARWRPARTTPIENLNGRDEFGVRDLDAPDVEVVSEPA